MPAQGSDLLLIERGGTLFKLLLSELAALFSSGVPADTIEVNLGSRARRSGRFTITGSGFTPGGPVIVQKAGGPYTGKGSRADEAEMDSITASATIVSATAIDVYWQSQGPVKGNIKFNYILGV